MQKSSPCGVGDRVYARVLFMYVNSVPACVAVNVHIYSHRWEANPSDLDSRLWEPVACGAKDGAPPRALRPAALLPLAADSGDERSSPGLRLSRSGAGQDVGARNPVQEGDQDREETHDCLDQAAGLGVELSPEAAEEDHPAACPLKLSVRNYESPAIGGCFGCPCAVLPGARPLRRPFHRLSLLTEVCIVRDERKQCRQKRVYARVLFTT